MVSLCDSTEKPHHVDENDRKLYGDDLAAGRSVYEFQICENFDIRIGGPDLDIQEKANLEKLACITSVRMTICDSHSASGTYRI